MDVTNSFTPSFIEGFVERCLEMGMTLPQTEAHFQKHAYNMHLASPNVYAGFRDAIAKASDHISPATLLRCMTPDILEKVARFRLGYGDDPLSIQVRTTLGMTEPEDLPEHVKEAAQHASSIIDSFDRMPMNQQVLLASLMGGGIGAARRMVSPNEEDQELGRGFLNRATRGGVRGAGIGAGAATGIAAGRSLSGSMDPYGQNQALQILSRLGGAAAGGMAGNQLAHNILH